MDQRYPLAEGRGMLTLRQEGVRAICRVELPDDGRGLYKAYLTGPGERHLLGTLMPEGGLLRIQRTVTVDELRRKNLWPPQGGAVELAFSAGQRPLPQHPRAPPGWTWETQPARLLGDNILRHAAQGLRGGLLHRSGAGFRLALPYRAEREFPLTPLFCFASLNMLEEKYYLVFSFNENGCPIFPAATGSSGQVL